MELNTIQSANQNTNTSGQGEGAIVPPELRRWNWGAFCFNWIWGIFNGVPIALLCFIPLINIVMPFVLGLRGNEWAWKNRRWYSVEEFKKTQKIWSVAAGILFACIFLFGLTMTGIIIYAVNADKAPISELVNKSLAGDKRVEKALGMPVKMGKLSNEGMQVKGSEGWANYSAPISGSLRSGELYIKAVKRYGRWEIGELVLLMNGDYTPSTIILKKGDPALFPNFDENEAEEESSDI